MSKIIILNKQSSTEKHFDKNLLVVSFYRKMSLKCFILAFGLFIGNAAGCGISTHTEILQRAAQTYDNPIFGPGVVKRIIAEHQDAFQVHLNFSSTFKIHKNHQTYEDASSNSGAMLVLFQDSLTLKKLIYPIRIM